MRKSNLFVLIGGVIITMMFFVIISLNGSVNAGEGSGNTADLQNIVNNAIAVNGTITLDKDYVVNNTVYFGNTTAENGANETKDVTLDLNGHTIKTSTDFANDKGVIEVNGDKYSLTIKDSGTTGEISVTENSNNHNCALFIRRGTVTINGGKFTSLYKDNKWGVIEVGHGNNNPPASSGTLIMNGGWIDSERFGVSLEKGKVEVNGGRINAYSAAIQTSYWGQNAENSLDFDNTEIVITGGGISSEVYTAIQQKSNGKIKISGGSISGTTGVYVGGGDVDITGGTIFAIDYTGKPSDLPFGTSGDVEKTAAVVANETNFENTNVTISGNVNLISEHEGSEAVWLASEEEDPTSVLNVEKATSNTEIAPQYISGALSVALTPADGLDTYYVGAENDQDIINAIKGLGTGVVTIKSGDIKLDELPSTLVIKNEGDGVVEVNGVTVPSGETVDLATLDDGKPDELDDEAKTKTGVRGNVAVIALGMLALAGVFASKKFLK